ncbi:MAG TPA: PspC domain-containing protein [Chitinophagaceae bacterium]|nr:PspC domain-containing protein [Chitinophagaceae bacterium]
MFVNSQDYNKLQAMYRLKYFIEWQAFGVCTAIGEKLGIATSRIRLWFIYISFLTMGSPLIIYMVMAFWLNIKKYMLSARRNPLKYL